MSKKDYRPKNRIYNSAQSIDPPVEIKEETVPKPKKAKIANCYAVNMRKGPSTDSELIRTLRKNMEILIHDVEGSYAKITVGNGTYIGYIPYMFCQEVN